MHRALLILLALVFPALAQDVRITEFLPVNTAGLQDQDATHQPWIELWNTNPAAKVTLTNWRLVHGASQWIFPTGMEIPPGEYLVVFASGKNRTVMTAPLHTNFSLSATGGGPLQLVRGDASVASTFATYPALPANVSYGRDGAEISQIGSYANPTPGDSNNYSGSGVAGKVAFSVSSRAFTGTLNVSLTQVTPVAGAVIRYTGNGTVPTSLSPQFNPATPITISATTQLRARVFEPGKLPGETETAGYLLLDGSTSDFSTAAPLIVVSNFGLGTFPDTGDQPAYMWVWQPGVGGRARFTDLPTLATRCAVDRRGSSTIGNLKTNFNLEARKPRDDDDRDIDLLGMGQGADWVFHAPYHFDRSLIHNPLMYTLSNLIGRAAMRSQMAEVFVETTGGSLSFTGTNSGDYYGLYNVMQKIRRGNDRIDVNQLRAYDNDAVSKTGGYIFKVDRQDAGDSGFSAGGATLAYYYPKEVEMKSPQRDPQEQYLTSYINAFKAALDSPTFTNPTTGYANWLDVPAAIDHHLLNVWSFNVDALRLSGYIHKDRGGKLVYGPIWDFDRALFSTDGRDSNPDTWRSQSGDLGTDFFNYGVWWSRIFTDPDFYQKYIDRWVELRRGMFAPAAVDAVIDALNAELTAEGVARDLARWGQGKRSWTNYSGVFYPAGQAAEIQRIKDYLQRRAAFFETEWVRPVTFNVDGGSVTPGSTLTMTAAPGSTIYYTLNGSDPRPSGGAAPSGPNVFTYTGPIVVNAITRVKARAYNAAFVPATGFDRSNKPPLISKWSGLRDVRVAVSPAAVPGNLAVTEVNYHPPGATAAELAVDPTFKSSDFEFIELKNVAATPVDLNGLQVTVGARFTFTNDTALTLQPGAYVIIAANPAALAARYGNTANVVGGFSGDLNNAGEQVVIRSAANAVIADFTYDDVWYPVTDGDGPSLEALDQAQLSVAAGWRASLRQKGSPGFEDVAPVITQNPEDLTVNPGQPIRLTVNFTGSPTPTVQWLKDGEEIEGAIGSAYEVAATEEHEGIYEAVVQNFSASVTSAPAVVAVNDPVVFSAHPLSQAVNPGTDVTLQVAVSGTAPFSYQWRKDGELLEGATDSMLMITAAEEDEGSYDVVVSNVVGPVPSEPALLEVNDPVQIVAGPVTQVVNPGDEVKLSVTASGTGPFEYAWRKGGVVIEGATAEEFKIAGAAETDEGTYDVVVRNPVGPEVSPAAVLVVNDPIQFVAQPVSLQVSPGGRATFRVNVTGTGPITYQWRRNEAPIEGATGSSYQIVAVTDADRGSYDVVVGNVVGEEISGAATLEYLNWEVAAGTYQGALVRADAANPAEDFLPGRLTALVTKTGRVTGKLEYMGLAHSFKGQLDVNLHAEIFVLRRNDSMIPVVFDLNGVADALEVAATDPGVEGAARANAPRTPRRPKGLPPALAGRYTILLKGDPESAPELKSRGYLAVNIAASGSASWVGKLPDTAAVKGSGWLSPANDVAFYSALYVRKPLYAGHIAGPLAVEPAGFSGEVGWRKPPQTKGAYLRNGIAAMMETESSPWLPGLRGVPVLVPGTLRFRVENVFSHWESNVDFTALGKFAFPPGIKSKLSVNRSTGLVTGRYYDGLFGRFRPVHGAVLQNQSRGEGFVPDAGVPRPWELFRPEP